MDKQRQEQQPKVSRDAVSVRVSCAVRGARSEEILSYDWSSIKQELRVSAET